MELERGPGLRGPPNRSLYPFGTFFLVALSVSIAGPAGGSRALCGEPATRRLQIIARDSYLEAIPLLVRLEIRDEPGELATEVWDAEARLSTEPGDVKLSSTVVTLRNGIGSVLVTVTGGTESLTGFTLTATVGDLEARHPLVNLGPLIKTGEYPVTEVEGVLPAALVEWSGLVHVTGDTAVPDGGTLRVHPGTLILIDGVDSGEDGSDISVEGTIDVQGSEERPVTFTASDPSRPWGELDHDEAEPSVYRYAHITRAGHSPRGGHTNTGPAIRSRGGSEIRFEFCAVSDNAGKVMQARGAALEFLECLLSRSVMGPEIDNSSLIFERSYILEMYGRDDNDGIYLHSQSEGQTMTIVGSVVASGDDDAIDTLGSEVTIIDCIVRDYADKGVSVFHDEVTVSRCLIVGNDIGISAKTGNDRLATVHVENSTLVGNRIGIQAENKGGDEPDARIVYEVTSSILRHSGDEKATSVHTDYDPEDIHIRYSDVEDGWPGEGNISENPLFVDPGAHNYRLRSDSPCIDAGDPEAERDPDGTPADMGVFPYAASTGEPGFVRGRVNGDESVDISDAIFLLLHLFTASAPSLGCLDAADVDGSVELDVTDAIFLLDYLFLEGQPPPDPFPICGGPPGTERVGCDKPLCVS